MILNTENNKVLISGTVVSEPVFSHEVYEEMFFTFLLDTPRLSEAKDVIKITISEKFLSGDGIKIGDNVKIDGQFRSYNNFSNIGNRLILTVFVKDIEKLDETDTMENLNSIYLNGYICKQPIYRTTPFGREIADILLAVNRSYNKSDYIPCIAWGRNAKYAETLNIGDNVIIKGRIQSREYQKKLSETEFELKTAYEISVAKLERVSEKIVL
ncbi:MAG: single-stranded DNA-binding protein [Clostridia bacterium]|nr:single-stranded DNA-binding protein [Clostridia bacterium]